MRRTYEEIRAEAEARGETMYYVRSGYGPGGAWFITCRGKLHMFQSYGTTSIPAFDNLYENRPGVTHPTTWHDHTNQAREGAVAQFFADLERKSYE